MGLKTAEAEQLLLNPDMSKVISEPPVHPKGGDVFLFSWAKNPGANQDWRCDQIKWKHGGARLYPDKGDARLRKIYHSHTNASGDTFKRHAFHLVQGPSALVLIQYTGNDRAVYGSEDIPHGNAKRQPTRPHVRTCPSVLKKVAEDSEIRTPHAIYKNLTSTNVPSESVPVLHPKDTAQVRNKVKFERAKKRLSHDEMFNVYQLDEQLGDFICHFTVLPELVVCVGLPEILQELDKLGKREDTLVLSYDTTFNLGDFYVSVLTMRHSLFVSDPVLPVAFMVHDKKLEGNHRQFLKVLSDKCPKLRKYKPVVITDREKAITNAFQEEWPWARQVFCWNHFLSDIKYWLKKHDGKTGDCQAYRKHVKELLMCETQNEYHDVRDRLKIQWSQAFLDYFLLELEPAILSSTGRWVLERLNLYTSDSGITTNASESFNAVIKRVVDRKEVALDNMVLILFYLQNFFYNEILRGFCCLGNFRLKSKHANFRRSISDTVFPFMMSNPDTVVEAVMEAKAMAPKEPSINSDCRSQLSLARMVINNNRISCVAEKSVFLVQGSKGNHYSVTLFPEEFCPCLSKGTCYHIIACRLAVGMPPGVSGRRNINLSTLKRNRRQRNKSGRKKPRVDDIDITCAPDSIKATMVEDTWNMSEGSPPSSPNIPSSSFAPNFSPVVTSTPNSQHTNKSFAPEQHNSERADTQTDTPWKICQFKLGHVKKGASVICAVGPFHVNLTDLASLSPACWLTEAVILAFLEKCNLQQTAESAVKFVVADSHVFAAWEKGEVEFVMKWSLVHRVFEKDVWLCPLLVRGNHWILVVLVRKLRQLIVVDSMHGDNALSAAHFLDMYQSLLTATYGKSFDSSGWCVYLPIDTPYQANGDDCGVFVCAAGHAIIRGKHGSYSQSDMPRMRDWVADTLLNDDSPLQATWIRRSVRVSFRKMPTIKVPTPEFSCANSLKICRQPPRGNDTMSYLTSIKTSLIEATWSTCYVGDACLKPPKPRKMLFCEGCLDWLHVECVSQSGFAKKSVDESHWMCDKCSVKSNL